MRWFWTDDLARLLVRHDGIDPGLVVSWVTRPTAVRGSDAAASTTDEALAIARRLLTGDTEQGADAA